MRRIVEAGARLPRLLGMHGLTRPAARHGRGAARCPGRGAARGPSAVDRSRGGTNGYHTHGSATIRKLEARQDGMRCLRFLSQSYQHTRVHVHVLSAYLGSVPLHIRNKFS